MAVHEIPTNQPPIPNAEERPLHHALLEQAEDAFFRDLPALLQKSPGYWVAYHGVERLGISYHTERLDRRFAVPPLGRLSLWERIFGCRRNRFAENELSVYFITPTFLEYEFDERDPIEADAAAADRG